MADVWISRKRWTCKYCNVTINDDIPSRRHHENGLRHKHNVERALRALHKENDAKRRAEVQAHMELLRIEKAASRDHRKHDRGSSSTASHPPTLSRPSAWTPTNNMASYTTAESLGVSGDEDAQWLAKRAKKKETVHIGEWETYTPTSATTSSLSSVSTAGPSVTSDRDEKRHFELTEKTLAEDEEDEEDEAPIVLKRPRTQPMEPVKKEEDETVPLPRLSTPPPINEEETPASDTNLFRKRKARSGTAKKIGSAGFV